MKKNLFARNGTLVLLNTGWVRGVQGYWKTLAGYRVQGYWKTLAGCEEFKATEKPWLDARSSRLLENPGWVRGVQGYWKTRAGYECRATGKPWLDMECRATGKPWLGARRARLPP
jgi:hypothetical protein